MVPKFADQGRSLLSQSSEVVSVGPAQGRAALGQPHVCL